MAHAEALRTPVMVTSGVKTHRERRLGHAIMYGAVAGVTGALVAATLATAGEPLPVFVAFAADLSAALGIFGAYAAAIIFGETA